jgi:hypothetical protein
MSLDDPEADNLLTRDQTAVALTAAGFPVRSATLASMGSRGNGPPFRSFGSRPSYRWGHALAWAESRLTTRRRKGGEASAGTVA